MTNNGPGCPVCKSRVAYNQLRFGFSFPCEVCKNYLYVSSLYSCVHGALALSLAILFAASLGFRRDMLIFVPLLLWFPMILVDVYFFVRSFPPKLRLHHMRDSPLSLGN
jgi:hypothetical protein